MIAELVVDCVVVGLIGGLLSLDRTGAFQVMISRPLVSAPLIGIVLGESMLGLSAGVIIELLYMADRPVGGYMPTHETALAVLVVALSAAFMTGSGQSGGAITLAGLSGALTVLAPVLLISILVAPIYRTADVFSRRLNEELFCEARDEFEAGTGSVAMLKVKNIRGLFNFFWPTSALLFVSVLILSLAAYLIGSKLGAPDGVKLYPVIAGFLVLGIAFALNALKSRGTLIVFSVCGVLTALIWTVVK
jgi:mannose/fructose/N-acetylgalactosamine-specific phosphotransferase system component IIC